MNGVMRGVAGVLLVVVAACGQRSGVQGGQGDDTLTARSEADAFDGGDGNDTVDYSGSDARITVRLWKQTGEGGHAQGDTYQRIENVIGSPHGDSLVGDAGPNRLDGGPGNDSLQDLDGDDFLVGGPGADRLFGGPGADRLDGGEGDDTADYSSSDARVVIRLWNGTGEGGHAQGDRLANIERVVGSPHNDGLVGANDVANRLNGGAGNDWLSGLSGDDGLDGGPGNDHLTGGPGADFFIFRAGEANGDLIADFSPEDSLLFVGYGAGASFARVDATHWRVSSADGRITETITIANGALIGSGRFRFVEE